MRTLPLFCLLTITACGTSPDAPSESVPVDITVAEAIPEPAPPHKWEDDFTEIIALTPEYNESLRSKLEAKTTMKVLGCDPSPEDEEAALKAGIDPCHYEQDPFVKPGEPITVKNVTDYLETTVNWLGECTVEHAYPRAGTPYNELTGEGGYYFLDTTTETCHRAVEHDGQTFWVTSVVTTTEPMKP